LNQKLTPKLTKYIPYQPTPRQTAFLLLDCKEAFYGGAAGGGKSVALLMAALQYVDQPKYSALLLRRTYKELALSGALMDLAAEWLAPFRRTKEVHWSKEDKTYTFPSGAKLTFGFLEHPDDKYRYQGAQFQLVGYDELTQFDEQDYIYLFSRSRRTVDMAKNVPLRFRSTSNPGGIGHFWVRKRFLKEPFSKRGLRRVFIPAVLSDNQHIDQDSYIENLEEMNPLEMAQLLNGDWEMSSGGKVFKREWFEIIDKLPETTQHITRVRYWDMAASEKNQNRGGYDPAFTVGLKMSKITNKGQKDLYVIEDIRRFQKLPDDVEAEIVSTAYNDGRDVEIWMEEEPGSSGKNVINDYVKTLKDFTFRGQKEGGSKVLRASKVAATAGRGEIKILRGHWNEPFLDEVEYFPDSKYKDQVDCLSGAFDKLRFFASYSVLPVAIAQEQGSYWLAQSV
jgi:predicted phage terminase large subunit-like protein